MLKWSAMTPGQISAVEESLATVDLDQLTADFYRRAFAEDPVVVGDVHERSRRAARALRCRARRDRALDALDGRIRTRAFGRSVRATAGTAFEPPTIALMGRALLAALAAALGERWTADVEEAWSLAYNLTAETMLLGAMERDG